MDIRDIIEALEESPFWKTIPAGEKMALVLHNADILESRSMAEILQHLSSDDQGK
ncbi:MAG TPA: hypothetical protein VK448_11505 [Dissulfurispiraceae bacterium]|nr:hypothetical protein [Dissulfurispiraceae bacterium]